MNTLDPEQEKRFDAFYPQAIFEGNDIMQQIDTQRQIDEWFLSIKQFWADEMEAMKVVEEQRWLAFAGDCARKGMTMEQFVYLWSSIILKKTNG